MSEIPIRPAATVIIVRDGLAGLEALLLRRNSQIAFHGGAWVFPGGRIDAADYAGAPIPDDPADDAHEPAARRAAVREAFEESGLVIATDALIPFSHWTTPVARIKRYSTWFFLAAAPGGPVTVDGSEITEHAWLSPSAALAGQAAGDIDLPPPTLFSLHRLAGSSSVDAVFAEAREAPYERFVP